jgi:hypothetical protein
METQEDEIGSWEIRQGAETLARLEEQWRDFPWVYCSFAPKPSFEPYRHLFTREGGIWRGREDELHKAIADAGIYVTDHGEPLRAFTITLNGSEARLTFTEV